jgi:hypothetical protein
MLSHDWQPITQAAQALLIPMSGLQRCFHFDQLMIDEYSSLATRTFRFSLESRHKSADNVPRIPVTNCNHSQRSNKLLVESP